MVVRADQTIQIPAPSFEQYESVSLHWNDEQYSTRIVRRIYDLEENCWLYEVSGKNGLFSADVLE